jgi:NADPH2:quinone reductase
VAGHVEAVGSGVSRVKIGDRVMANAFGGGLAEYIVLPQAAVTPIPDRMTFAQAAGFGINYITALHGLKDRARIEAGERLLVMGAAGGVGSAAVQVGALLEAEVIGCASTPEKRAFAADHGAQATVDTEVEGWRDRLKAACGGKGPDVVFDPVSGPLFEAAFRSLTWRGRHLVIGFVGGPIPKLPINLTLMKGAALVGVDVRQFFIFEGERAQAHRSQLLGWVAEGRLVPPPGRRFEFEKFAEAMRYALSGSGSGKTVIEVSPES